MHERGSLKTSICSIFRNECRRFQKGSKSSIQLFKLKANGVIVILSWPLLLSLLRLLDLEFSLEASGYHKLTARTVRTRRPRAQMFTVVPQKRSSFFLLWLNVIHRMLLSDLPGAGPPRWPPLAGPGSFSSFTGWRSSPTITIRWRPRRRGSYRGAPRRSTSPVWQTSWGSTRASWSAATPWLDSTPPSGTRSSAGASSSAMSMARASPPVSVNSSHLSPWTIPPHLTGELIRSGSRVNYQRKYWFSSYSLFPLCIFRHWKPNWVLCNPCLYNYDFILKMETFDRDSGALLRKVELESF